MSGDDPKFSPNGQLVSYVRDGNLYVQRIDGSEQPLALTNSTDPTLLNGAVDWVYLEELDVRSNYFWSPDSREIAYLQMNEAGRPPVPARRLDPGSRHRRHAALPAARRSQSRRPRRHCRRRRRRHPLDQNPHRLRQRLHPALRLGQSPHRLGRDPLPQPSAPRPLVRRHSQRRHSPRPSAVRPEVPHHDLRREVRRRSHLLHPQLARRPYPHLPLYLRSQQPAHRPRAARQSGRKRRLRSLRH